MQSVTIAMDDALVRLTEVEAAKAGKSLSDFISELVARSISPATEAPPSGQLTARQEALHRIWAGPMWDVTENGRMPTAEERNARR